MASNQQESHSQFWLNMLSLVLLSWTRDPIFFTPASLARAIGLARFELQTSDAILLTSSGEDRFCL